MALDELKEQTILNANWRQKHNTGCSTLEVTWPASMSF